MNAASMCECLGTAGQRQRQRESRKRLGKSVIEHYKKRSKYKLNALAGKKEKREQEEGGR